MTDSEHLSPGLILRYFDGECTGGERAEVERHIGACGPCSEQLRSVAGLSADLEALLSQISPSTLPADRSKLDRALAEQEVRSVKRPGAFARNISVAAAALAAILAGVVFVSPRSHRLGALRTDQQPAAASAPNSTFEVSGETFVALPYSNPDLPVNSTHIVQMQVPVASLMDAGIVDEPEGKDTDSMDRSVLADVLIGSDGEPVGVHVLNGQSFGQL